MVDAPPNEEHTRPKSVEDRYCGSRTAALRRQHEETICRLLSAAVAGSAPSAPHLRRIGLGSELLARAAGWSADAADDLRTSPPCCTTSARSPSRQHPSSRPGKMFLEEFEVIKKHPIAGARFVGRLRLADAANGPSDRACIVTSDRTATAIRRAWPARPFPKVPASWPSLIFTTR